MFLNMSEVVDEASFEAFLRPIRRFMPSRTAVGMLSSPNSACVITLG